MADFQRARLLGAALNEVCASGGNDASVASIVARAGVSRKTFYELFESREDCFTALVEESILELARVVVPVYEREGTWRKRLRAALGALLQFFEHERELGLFVLGRIVGHGSLGQELRAPLLARLRDAIEDGRTRTRSRATPPPPLAAEFVVGGVLAIVYARLQTDDVRELSELVNQLMWMIVLPFVGPAAAAAELCHPPLKSTAAPPARPPRPAHEMPVDLDMRMTYRTARVLEAIAEQPAAGNFQIAARAGITDQGQISKLLARLARLELIENTGMGHAKGAANAWHLTRKGREVDTAIRRELGFNRHTHRSR
jgi:AcrR family transcriptional regulator/DNA-binding MarR family transcriptional regulator